MPFQLLLCLEDSTTPRTTGNLSVFQLCFRTKSPKLQIRTSECSGSGFCSLILIQLWWALAGLPTKKKGGGTRGSMETPGEMASEGMTESQVFGDCGKQCQVLTHSVMVPVPAG